MDFTTIVGIVLVLAIAYVLAKAYGNKESVVEAAKEVVAEVKAEEAKVETAVKATATKAKATVKKATTRKPKAPAKK